MISMNRNSKMGLFVLVIVIVFTALSSPVSSSRIIGIDLGTTQSVVSVTENGKTTIIANEQGNRITPSIVAFTDTDRLIGDSAKNQISRNYQNTIFDAKRFIGRSFSDKSVQKDLKLLPFSVVDVNNKPHFRVNYKGNKHDFTAEEISAMILTKMKRIAESYLGETVESAVITVPAHFDDRQRQSTKDAGTIAGLDVVRIINEPTSAAIAYGIDKRSNKESNIVVYDLGGGTFDVSLLTLDEGIFEVIANGGDTHLGGEDFDENVMKFMIKQFKKKNPGVDLRQNVGALSRLRKECEKAKRALSSAKQVKIEIENIEDGLDLSETLTRARFEDLNDKMFRKTLQPLKQILNDANMKKSDIDEIVLVGGSTRIPKIQTLVQDFFNGKQLNRGINPDEAIAYGASIQAAIIGGHYDDTDQILVIDSTPLSLGIETVGGIMTKIIPRNTIYPTQKSQIFSTHQDNQETVLIQIFQGERAQTKDNRFLGKFMLNGIPKAPRGTPQIKVQFEIDANGLLQVEANDESGAISQKISITRDDHSNLDQSEIDEMVEEFEKYKEEDDLIIKAVNAKNQLESSLYQLKRKVADDDSNIDIDVDDMQTLQEIIQETDDWLLNNQDASLDDIVEKQEELDDVVNSVMGGYAGTNTPPNGYDDDYMDHEDL